MKYLVYILIIAIFLESCTKKWLDERSDKQLAVPTTVKDTRALLDNNNLFNGQSDQFSIQELSETGSDNFVLSTFAEEIFRGALPALTNAYTFEKDIFAGQTNLSQWNIPYKRIFTANVILETLNKMTEQSTMVLSMKGEALFHRAHAFFWLAQLYCKAYNPQSAATDAGLPLRLVSDPNEVSTRSTVQQTYDRIITDLRSAIMILPVVSEGLRPNAAAAEGLLARTFLFMGQFDSALVHVDACLALNNQLIDYSGLNTGLNFPVPQYNEEVIFSDIIASSLFHPFFCVVDTALYVLYQEGDLRKSIFFKEKEEGVYSFNGGYDGGFFLFGGLATDEIWLMKAECHARLEQNSLASAALNELLQKRWAAENFIPVPPEDNNLLHLILQERRKELCFRGLRWPDIKRLNVLGADITIHHVLGTAQYMLPPRSSLSVYPIPEDIIAFTGMEQNAR